ncbi:hypothetical protein B0A69_16695 [Chryseobacterium shigense]|uniref:Beta/Gamma crystallin n=1 Tax=Chryseobacterium shigense TaxID=297244 RepID=A0A1N7HX51_9FLAO|nr:hypothetical protein [Chryseobacterium shigense]PQA92056.1 hypothetical protein B0A69_16695 [Chryseobacterium shigense]SIS29424.1 hypothetical protein SAMN05421639_101466 [Chryseobacterium shigense]
MKKIILALALMTMPTVTVLANNVNPQPFFKAPVVNSHRSLSKVPNYISYANSISSVTDAENFKLSCRKFTIEVSIGIVSVSTDVTVCIEPNGYGGWQGTISKAGNDSTDLTEVINRLKAKCNEKEINQVQILSPNAQTFDDGLTLVIDSGTYSVLEQDGRNYVALTLSKK